MQGISWSDALSIISNSKKSILEKKITKPPLECLDENPKEIFDDFQAKVQSIRRSVMFASLCIDTDCILTNLEDGGDSSYVERDNWSIHLQ